MTTSLLSTLYFRALDVLFPPRCVSCNAFGAFICDRCRPQITRADPPRCRVCWIPGDADRCDRCRYQPPAFRAVRAAFVYEGPTRDAVHALKYYGVTAAARTMAVPMAEALLRWDPPLDALVPVPLAGARRRTRGYNQSELLAREISRLIHVPLVTNVLHRTRSAAPQVRQPDEDARRLNVRDAFAPGRRAPSGNILLVDDVLTTGATLDACARVLLSAGAVSVYALTFARED